MIERIIDRIIKNMRYTHGCAVLASLGAEDLDREGIMEGLMERIRRI